MKSKAIAKVAAVAAGLAMATSMLSFAPMVHAATLTSAQTSAILSLLSSFGASSATIASVNAALTGTTVTSGSTTTTSGNSSCSFSRNLTIGSTGADVTCLQNALIASGFSISAGATGYFGTQTRSAVASWQSSRNVAPAVGYFGAISRAAWNLGGSSSTSTNTTTTTTTTTSTVAGCVAGAVFSATTGAACASTSTVAGCAAGAVFSATTGQACSGTVTVTTGALTGTGRLTNVSSLSDTTSDIKEGAAATQVAGFSADATGGDVKIERVDVRFDITPGSGSSNLDAYVSDVSLYLDGKLLQHMDPALGDKSTGAIWDLRFTGLNGVIKSGATGNLYVKVTPVSSVSSTNIGGIVPSFLVDSVRAVGADGISDTYPVAAITASSFTVTAATSGTLTMSIASNNPVADLVKTATTTTTGVNLLSFNMKAKNSAVTVTDLGAGLSVSAGLVASYVSQVQLMKGSTVIKTGTMTANGTYSSVVFSGVDQTIAADATGAYWISVDLKNDSGYADSSTLTASTTASTDWDVSDAAGDTVTPSAAVGGNAQTLMGTGFVRATLVSATATKETVTIAGTPDKVNASIVFTLTADAESDIYLDATLLSNITTVLTNSSGFAYATTTDSTTGTTTSATLSAGGNVDSLDLVGSYYRIAAGASRTFTLTASASAGIPSSAAGIRIVGFNYGTTNATMTKVYDFNLGSYKTPTIPSLTTH